jgi:UDP-N-acetylmuramate: L-alanyl-gamma-D-glutamyl-meso-diaminopimelate ligase
VAAALAPLAGRAHTAPDTEALTALITAHAQRGDTLVVMSNGAFEGIHERLIQRLGSSASMRAGSG